MRSAWLLLCPWIRVVIGVLVWFMCVALLKFVWYGWCWVSEPTTAFKGYFNDGWRGRVRWFFDQTDVGICLKMIAAYLIVGSVLAVCHLPLLVLFELFDRFPCR